MKISKLSQVIISSNVIDEITEDEYVALSSICSNEPFKYKIMSKQEYTELEHKDRSTFYFLSSQV